MCHYYLLFPFQERFDNRIPIVPFYFPNLDQSKFFRNISKPASAYM